MKDWLSRKVRFVKATLNLDNVAQVELERGGSTYIGTAENQGAGLEAFRAGAEAAAQAVQQAADSDDAKVEIRKLEVVKVVGETLVVVNVTASFRGETRSLFGVCQVQEDRAATGALAVLSATNRVFDLA